MIDKPAYVEFERDERQGNPVIAYLQRHECVMARKNQPLTPNQ
jgi:hypothetical protein